ncbi:hypothetical protein D1605_007605 [Xylella fastidiosa subsp. fastidiosa]|uniref:Uncharacterized protein n=3 Tax=Xylella fastidiosa TaxID=2371 RepID=Q87BN0_XYLFT|nr:hypothetical protein [Xylella fastidiosa]ADN62264.1 hypothetical protein XFLM_01260 [Xylella fastidiosa subsp. fastidiosa GB514]KAF0571690.1 hypothetical protein P305_03425 [Xylella fastidiosa subsp. fastidiosa Mus-1]AAO29265.1 conserved hypothetical protein [Xylella fastidiosa Temecula1]ACB92915.1 hypothetical protein XfasM23_1505 [Xylella fastidiosa M23]KGM20137.1 hypothetical protein JT24_07895 [Xylella fastidiosa]
MNIPRLLKRLLKLCGLLALALLMVFGAILSCGKNNMTKTTPQQAAAQDIKEVSKIMMLQSDDHSYKKCFKFPQEVMPIQFDPSKAIFYFKNIGYLSGIETSPGNLGEAGTSIVALIFFPDQPWKEYYIHAHLPTGSNKQVEIMGEYKEFYFYHRRDSLYSAIDKTGLFNIEYQPGQRRNKEELISDLKLIIDFVNTHTIPCQGKS